ncbi:DUF1345 domain-containing protein [Paenibacillus sp. SYP-B3998]|nr:DUF1345 domain-containing protein [Paenibacillus sp. SYP-B3998]
MEKSSPPNVRVPRFSFLFAILAIGTLLSVLSENLTLGPRWSILIVAIVLLIPMIVTIFKGHHRWTRLISLSIISVLTLGLISSVLFLIHSLFTHIASAAGLFQDAGLLWSANILVFAVWYWEVDQGGPLRRHCKKTEDTDFLFPQKVSESPQWVNWSPSFLDYFFLAFNTNTAFSPTDTMVLSKRAKCLIMMQSSISLLIVVVLAARAINIA